MAEPCSWLPVMIESPDGGHLHGLIWWQWDRVWGDSTLPKAVKLLGLGADKATCETCRQWVSFDTAGSLQRPEDFTPEEARKSERQMAALPDPEKENSGSDSWTEKGAETPKVVEAGETAPVEARSNSFNDF